ncbi:hypothetical protein HN51_048641 [Arachis hypogaea]
MPSPKTHPWNAALYQLTRYKPAELKECAQNIHDLYLSRRGGSLQAVREKYKQHKVYDYLIDTAARDQTRERTNERGAWLPSSLPAPSMSSSLELREAVFTIDVSPRCLWVVTSSASAITPSSVPLDIAAFKSCPITCSLPPRCGPTSN